MRKGEKDNGNFKKKKKKKKKNRKNMISVEMEK